MPGATSTVRVLYNPRQKKTGKGKNVAKMIYKKMARISRVCVWLNGKVNNYPLLYKRIYGDISGLLFIRDGHIDLKSKRARSLSKQNERKNRELIFFEIGEHVSTLPIKITFWPRPGSSLSLFE